MIAVTPDLEPGYCPGVTLAEYRAWNLLSHSRLEDLRVSPATFRWRETQPHEETDDTILGTAMHVCILQPELWSVLYALKPEDAPKRPDKRQRAAKKPSAETVAAIKWWDDFAAANQGKTILSREAYDFCLFAREATEKNPEARDLLAACPEREVPVIAVEPAHRLMLKGCPDARGGSVMLDLKKCAKGAGAYSFRRNVTDYGYDRQEALYRCLAEWAGEEPVTDFAFLAFDNSGTVPVDDACLVWRLDAPWVAQAMNENAELIDLYARCVRTNTWPTRKGGVIACPGWVRTENHDADLEDVTL